MGATEQQMDRALAAAEARSLAAPSECAPEPAEDQFDADTFCDWLMAECWNAVVPWQRHQGEKTSADFDGFSAAQLLAVALDIGQPAWTRCAAMDALGERSGVMA